MFSSALHAKYTSLFFLTPPPKTTPSLLQTIKVINHNKKTTLCTALPMTEEVLTSPPPFFRLPLPHYPLHISPYSRIPHTKCLLTTTTTPPPSPSPTLTRQRRVLPSSPVFLSLLPNPPFHLLAQAPPVPDQNHAVKNKINTIPTRNNSLSLPLSPHSHFMLSSLSCSDHQHNRFPFPSLPCPPLLVAFFLFLDSLSLEHCSTVIERGNAKYSPFGAL